MSYQSFYRKYRPHNFEDVVGQKPIIKTLQNSLKNNKIGHAYLFCGPRGTGKTTMARILAKALNCSKGLGSECNECENCLAIMNGSHPDIYEIDAASNSGVDNVRDLIEQVRYQPILGKYKVYIIDEVHSMTPTAFNALLKTLEEPPANVIFILATTEPQKVLPTILSRVQRFDFGKLTDNDLVELMKMVLFKENISYEEGTLQLIARLADGGARDSLSILEQVVAYGGERIQVADVQTLFGLISIDDKIKLINNIHDKKMKDIIVDLKQKYAQGVDIVRLHDELIAIYKDLLVFGTTRDATLLQHLKPEEAMKILIGPSELKHNIETLVDARRTYRLVNNSFDHLELTLIKLVCESDKVKDASAAIPVINKEKENSELATSKVTVVENVKEELPSARESPKFSEENKAALEDLGMYHLRDDEILNIMIQGDKNLKEHLIEDWDKLSEYISDPNTGAIVSYLKITTPRIANPSVVVVEAGLISQVCKINARRNKDLFATIFMKIFGFAPIIYAMSVEEYIKAVSLYRQLAQANKLPKPSPIEIK